MLLTGLMLVGCEVIREEDRIVTMDSVPVPTGEKGQLLIEYTGVGCVNCPNAAETAHELETVYPNLIVVAMHPKSNPFTKAAAKYDYTCPEADVYYQFMGGLATTPFPTGNLNFTPAEDETYFTAHSTWAAQLMAHRQDTALLSIAVEASIGDTPTEVELNISLVPKAASTRPYRLMLWVTEDSIVGAQNMPDGSTKLDYVHNHMLRTSLNGDWGQQVTFTKGEMLNAKATYTLSDKWVTENCHIIVVLIDDETREAVNAAKAEIKN